MKKRIGNDITFSWHIYRKSGESQTPESFTGKEVEVKLISPLQRPVTIEDVSIATGVVTFTFKGKHQVTLGNYVAVLLENKGEDGMVTLDVVDAVTLVPHSYMEEDDDEGDVIEATSVELESTISAGGGGGFVQQQADWAQTDTAAVDYIKNKPDLDLYCRKDADNTHSDGVSDTFAKLVYDERNPSLLIQADRLTVGGDSIKFYHSHRGEETKELLLQLDDVEKLKNLPTGEELAEDLENYARLNASNEHEQDTFDTYKQLYGGEQELRRTSIGGGGLLLRVGQSQPVWLEYEDVEKIKRTATSELDGLMSAADKQKLTDIEAVIPEQASPSNKLVDEDSMNSSIATATATYRGAYNLVTDLHLSVSATHAEIASALATAIQTADNNDYCYVQIPVADAIPTEFASVERYKFNGTAWGYEYTLNNSGFTAAQWAALNSGITSGLVAKLSDLPTATELATLLAGKASTQELAGKQDKMPIMQVASGTTAINAAVNTYYEVAGTVGTLAITLPVPDDTDKVAMVVIHLATGASPSVVIGSTATVDYSDTYSIEASKEYEINCLFNGDKWIVADMEVL